MEITDTDEIEIVRSDNISIPDLKEYVCRFECSVHSSEVNQQGQEIETTNLGKNGN